MLTITGSQWFSFYTGPSFSSSLLPVCPLLPSVASLPPVNTAALNLHPIRPLYFPFFKVLLWASELCSCQLFHLDTLDFLFLCFFFVF